MFAFPVCYLNSEFAILSRKDQYDHIGSIAEKVFLSLFAIPADSDLLTDLPTFNESDDEDQKTHSNALQSPKETPFGIRSDSESENRNKRNYSLLR